MVTVSDYRLAVVNVQNRAEALERDLYNISAVEIRALIVGIQSAHLKVTKATPLHNMTAYYREIMQDVAEGLASADKAAEAAIACGFRFIRR